MGKSDVTNEVQRRISILDPDKKFSALAFEEYSDGRVCLSRPSMMADDCCALVPVNTTLEYADVSKKAMDLIEENVYMIFLSQSGNLAFLFLSDDEEEWETERGDLKKGTPLAYVLRRNDPTMVLDRIRLEKTKFAPAYCDAT